jgi:ABC-type transport system involved in multi-copper enzyme maturation permease subunit
MGSSALREMFRYETWLVVSLVTLGAGAAAIAEDLTFKAFQFYFSKPVTPVQYLAGRVSAIAILIFAMTFLGGLFVVLISGVTAQPENRAEDFLLLAPMVVYALVLSVFMASASVAVSCVSPSRALTMSAWGLLFVVPHVIASIVDTIANGEFPWLYLASFTGLLGTVADALFKVEGESDLQWFHAAPILVAIAALGLVGAHERLRRAEVIK